MLAPFTAMPLFGSSSVMAGPRTRAERLPGNPARAQPIGGPSSTSHWVFVISERQVPGAGPAGVEEDMDGPFVGGVVLNGRAGMWSEGRGRTQFRRPGAAAPCQSASSVAVRTTTVLTHVKSSK